MSCSRLFVAIMIMMMVVVAVADGIDTGTNAMTKVSS